MVRIELTVSCAQDTRATGAPHPDEPIDPCGIRTRPGQLERLATSPEVERALSVDVPSLFSGTARNICWRWAGRRSNPSLLVFSQVLNRLSYQPIQSSRFRLRRKTRKPDVLCVTPGLLRARGGLGPMSRAQGIRGFSATQTCTPRITSNLLP